MIKLTRLAVVDISVTFARNMGNNKIIHYRVPAAMRVLAHSTGKSSEDIVTEYLKAETGEDVQIIDPVAPNGFMHHSGKMEVKDITDILLADYSDIKKSLLAKKPNRMIMEYFDEMPKLTSIFNKISNYINTAIMNINNLIFKMKLRYYKLTLEESWHDPRFYKIHFIPYIPMKETDGYRRISCASFLSVAFEEGDEAAAMYSLVGDLAALQKEGLILGHLSMPSMMMLADTVGSGKSSFVIFCFPFVDSNRLAKLLNKKETELPRQPLGLIGIKNETSEGSINYLNGVPSISKYDIEEIVIGGISEENRIAVIENYEETKKFVNASAANAQKRIENFDIVDRGTENLSVVNKETGEITKVSEMYKKNRQ